MFQIRDSGLINDFDTFAGALKYINKWGCDKLSFTTNDGTRVILTPNKDGQLELDTGRMLLFNNNTELKEVILND